MNVESINGTITTVVSFVVFIGIVVWAWSKRRRKAFDEAANAPFALPDDAVDAGAADRTRGERRP